MDFNRGEAIRESIAEKNEVRERDAKREIFSAIDQIVEQQRIITEAAKKIVEQREILKNVSYKEIDQNAIIG